MNIGGYTLGVLLVIKLAIRWWKGYRPPRWDEARTRASASSSPRAFQYPKAGSLASGLTDALALTTVAILGYVLISALNARATARFIGSTLTFEYRDCLAWLPHSLDSAATWSAFWTYLGLASAFWAVRDWLLGKSDAEQRAEWQKAGAAEWDTAPSLPERFRRLLWLLAINGALLGIECIIQRFENSNKLLFLVQPRIHKTAVEQFGPYAYRSNAAQYFNLLWPVVLGFWWTLNRNAASRARHHLLLVAGIIMAASPIISTSRAGAIVSIGIALFAAAFLLVSHLLFVARRPENGALRVVPLTALGVFFTTALALGFSMGWGALAPRLKQLNDGFEGRQLMYDAARPMADDYPLFGTGAGTFESVSYLYPRPDIYWPPQLHNDWLETRITFGWVGSSLIASAFALVILRWFARGGIHGGRRFIILSWLALAGCLAHARYDFPFQIHSVLFLFLLVCAALSTLSRRP
jgi:hypothetical protein